MLHSTMDMVAEPRSASFFFPSPLPFGGSTVLSLTRGPARNRTITGRLSATQKCRDTHCTTRTTTPSLEAPRLQALETGPLSSKEQKGKDCHDQASRYKGLVLGSFLAPEIDMIFGDGVGASLVVQEIGC